MVLHLADDKTDQKNLREYHFLERPEYHRDLRVGCLGSIVLVPVHALNPHRLLKIK